MCSYHLVAQSTNIYSKEPSLLHLEPHNSAQNSQHYK